ncbi:MAG TPA: hypothetical protein PKB10_11050, partial [Tepidisphaeraceae bacterium]|nr:hypothetical protein [Tepidisphaeraceae bacterium]
MKIDRFILSCLFVLLASTMLRAEADGLSRATEQLAAGQYAEARDAFLAITAQDPRNATALHGAGIAMLQLGDTARALQQLQRAHTLRPTDRAISINYAAALIRSRNPMRAVRVLIDVQPAPERPLDEPLLDALQYALSVADENARKNRLFTEGQAAANAMVARLESARPGWKRFGSSWRLAAEVDAIVARNEAKRARVQTLVADGVKAERQLQQLRAEARVIEKRVQHGFDWPGRLDAHMERVRDTERQIERVRQEIEQTEAEIIPPPAPAPLEPVAMDSTAPPFENWSAPADPSPLAPPLFQEDADNAPRDPPAIATPPSAAVEPAREPAAG